MLTVLESLPEGLLEYGASELYRLLDGPTLIHLPGRRPEPLFVSVLMHGNEDTGWEAVRALLRDYAGRDLPRALSLFIGNVAAARHGRRLLNGQPDYNRVWKGSGLAEQDMMARVVEEMRRRRVFASIDFHNNTGHNPHYACINRLEDTFMQLAILFSRTVVYFTQPDGVQSMAFAELCPAVTVECGMPGQAHGIDHAREFVNAALHLQSIPAQAPPPGDIDLFHTVAVVKVPEVLEIDFSGGKDSDLSFSPDVDRLNFSELPANTVIGRLGSARKAWLEAWDEQGNDVSDQYFRYDSGEIRLTTTVMPSMLSCDPRIVRQDCLCYLMERLPARRVE
jgi:hypothetical protein